MSSKSKAKKEAQRAATAFEAARRAVIKAANEAEGEPRNVIAAMGALLSFNKGGVSATLSFTTPAIWPADVLPFVFELTKHNMRASYDAAPGWTWNDSAKRAELSDPDNRFIVVREKESGSPVAFASFRFVLEGDAEALYIFELQLSDAVQRRGLGKHLMIILELVARQQRMHKVVLTVLKANAAAVRFYEQMRYEVDEDSPSRCGDEDQPHEILSKVVNRAALAERTAELDALHGSGGSTRAT